MSVDVWQDLQALREELFAALGPALEKSGGHCKSYEGHFIVSMPNYFEQQSNDVNGWSVQLNCYLIGPNRHYEWCGQTFREAVDLAAADVRAWIRETGSEA